MMPNAWQVAKLKDISEFRRGSFPQPYGLPEWYDDENGFPFVQVYDVDGNGKLKPVTKRKISKAAAAKSVFVPAGTILITIQGSIGRVAITQYDAYVDRTLLIISKLNEEIDKTYFSFILRELFELEAQRAPGGTIKTITKEALSEFTVQIPPKNEQEKIAKILSTWDEAIEKIDSLLKAKLKSKSYYVSSMLNPHQNGWKTYRLSDLGEISKGKGIAKSDITEAGIPCIRYGEIYTTHHTVIRCFKSHISKETAKESKRLNKGDIVFAGSGETAEEIGKSVAYLRDEEAYVGGDTIILSPSSHSSLFLSYVFNSLYTRRQLNVLGQGNAVVHLYPKALADVTVGLPEVAQQIKIANCLNSLDEEVLVYKQLIEKIKTQKQGLMQQLLTGKKRVKV